MLQQLGGQNYQYGGSQNNQCGSYYVPYYQNLPSWPSHVTHSWQGGFGSTGGDPFAAVVAAMNRLSAALERYNEKAR
jgi:hypothetical protein